MPGRKVRSPIIGRWRITEMEQWDRNYCDMEVPAFIEFRPDGFGEFQFGLVWGDVDHRLTERDNRPAVEWSWDGTDENGPCCGRGRDSCPAGCRARPRPAHLASYGPGHPV